MMRLIYLDPALADIEVILDIISKDNPSAALRFGDGLLKTCQLFKANPELGAARDDLSPGLRQFTYRGYSIYYRIDHAQKVVRIGRVLHPALDVDRQSFD
jgi:plasmid stabilization system protein ParE